MISGISTEFDDVALVDVCAEVGSLAHDALRPDGSTTSGGALGHGATPDPCKAVLGALLGFARSSPKRARLLFVESLAAGASSRARRDRLLASLAHAVEAEWARRGADAEGPDVPAFAIVGGVCRLLAWPTLPDGLGPGGLLAPLSAWVDSYWVPGGRARWRGPAADTMLARVATVPPHVDPSQVDERRRIACATAHAIFERGYGACTVERIATAAAVSEETFVRHFADRHAAAMGALELAYEQTFAAAARAFVAELPWGERMCRVGIEQTALVLTSPALMHLAFSDAPELGESAIELSHERLLAFTLLLEEGYAQSPAALALPRIVSAVLASTVFEFCHLQCTQLREPSMADSLPQRLYVSLAPFLGPETADRLVRKIFAQTERTAARGQPQ